MQPTSHTFPSTHSPWPGCYKTHRFEYENPSVFSTKSIMIKWKHIFFVNSRTEYHSPKCVLPPPPPPPPPFKVHHFEYLIHHASMKITIFSTFFYIFLHFSRFFYIFLHKKASCFWNHLRDRADLTLALVDQVSVLDERTCALTRISSKTSLISSKTSPEFHAVLGSTCTHHIYINDIRKV